MICLPPVVNPPTIPVKTYTSYKKSISFIDSIKDSKRKKILIGRSVKELPVYAYRYKRGKTSRRTLITGNIHGVEQGLQSAVLSFIWKLQHSSCFEGDFVIVPVVNPDGKNRSWRTNFNRKDLNRDFAKQKFTQPESKAIRKLILKYRPTHFIDIHMRGNVLLTPRNNKSKKSKALCLRLKKELNKKRGLYFWTRNGRPKGMMINYTNSLGIASCLIELGRNWPKKKTEPLIWRRKLQKKYTNAVANALFNIVVRKGRKD